VDVDSSAVGPIDVMPPLTVDLPWSPAAPAAAREFVRTHSGSYIGDEPLIDIVVMTSELASNAYQHGESPITLTVEADRSTLTVTVDDAGRELSLPELHPTLPSPDCPHGRGLPIVDAFADRWGTTPNAHHGKSVWFTVRRTRASA
jgi:anti-sigma regulatory factor (Ser/Thr protein kinase)